MSKLRRVSAMVYSRPWFIIREQLDTISDIVQFHADGGRLSPEDIQARLELAAGSSGPRRGGRTVGSVQIIPIYGTIFPKANLMTDYSGGATCDGIRAAFRAAMDDETVGSILFDVDSPGGYVDGIDELTAEIRAARGKGKAIVASACYTMASAAYYVASAADEIVASPSSMVGWIGTVLVHQEFSKMDEMDGVTTTIFRNPPRKYEGNSLEPLTAEAGAEFQRLVDEHSSMFVSAVAKGRGVSTAVVKADYGQGTGMTASRAKAAGLVDRVEDMETTIRRLATGRGPVSRGTSAIASADDLHAALELPDNLDVGIDDRSVLELEASPPDRSKEAEAALALARAKAR